MPQIWRAGTPDDLKLQRALSTRGLVQDLSAGLGPYPGGMDETVSDDEVRARFAIRQPGLPPNAMAMRHQSPCRCASIDVPAVLQAALRGNFLVVQDAIDAMCGIDRQLLQQGAHPGSQRFVCRVSEHRSSKA